MSTYFSDHFGIDRHLVKKYGSINISLVTDLPLFIDPFLLFNSKKAKYRALHDEIIRYLRFLRNKAQEREISPGLLHAWYQFPEVKQNWFGFTQSGNQGSGLGSDFAKALHASLYKLFPEFGEEQITKGSHLEKLCLIKEGVGRDNISDFATNLIKGFLCDYTQEFARKYLKDNQRRTVAIRKAQFNYETESWETKHYELPWVNGDYVLLTPKDILTKDDTWINKSDLVENIEHLPDAIPNEELRAQINNYLAKMLTRNDGKEPTKKEMAGAARNAIFRFPELIDYYIRYKEEHGDQAESISTEKVRRSEQFFIQQIAEFQMALATATDFYKVSGNTYEEAHQRIAYLKDVIEHKGGHRIFYDGGKPIDRESDIHVMYRLVWFGTPSDVNREVNDGRGPADFKISRGAKDKTIVEFKLAKNTQLRRNLERQIKIYQKASDARNAIKVILFFSDEELMRVKKILKDLRIDGHRDVILIDARYDNKPSGSKA